MGHVCAIHGWDYCLTERAGEDGRRQIVCAQTGRLVARVGSAVPTKSAAARRAEPPPAKPEWGRAAQWGEAIAQTIFDGRYAGRPVYLDLDEDVLRSMAALLDPPPEDPEEDLVKAVASALDLRRRRWLKPAVDRLVFWERSHGSGPPPVLAVLAVLVLAAEKMRSSEDMSSRNYYGRLCVDVFGLDSAERDRIAHGFRQDVELLFGALNEWLDREEGARGLPTARPGHSTYRYVGYPVSQALLREGDRERISQFFVFYGLTPGTVVASDDLRRLLVDFHSRSRGALGSNLSRIIASGGEALSRLTELVADELASWDGEASAGRAGTAADVSDLRLALTFGGFPHPQLRLSLVVRHPDGQRGWAADADAEQILGQRGRGELRPLGEGWSLIETHGQPVWDVVLSQSLRIRVGERSLERAPRRVVVLRHDPALSRWVEVDRVAAGEDATILATEQAAPGVVRALRDSARPGWDRKRGFGGLPPGWELFTGVQVLAPHQQTGSADLAALMPAARGSLTLGGGLRLPGQPRRWHAQDPPEIRLSVLDGRPVRVTVHPLRRLDGRVPGDPIELGSHESVAIITLKGLDLPAGDYRVDVVDAQTGASVLPSATVRLRDGNHLAVTRIAAEPLRLGHTAGAPAAGLTAIAAPKPPYLSGGMTVGEPRSEAPLPSSQPPVVPGWVVARAAPLAVDVSDRPVPSAPPPCFDTGAHRFDLDEAGRRAGLLDAACTYCGKRKFFPTRPVREGEWEQRLAALLGRMTRSVSVSALEGVDAPDLSPDVVLDALTHLREGTAAELDTVLRAGYDAVEAHTLRRNLEALGHIEIERGGDLEPTRWCVTPSTLVVLPITGKGVTAVLAGARNGALVEALRAATAALGAGVAVDVQPGVAPVRISVHAGTVDVLRAVAHRVRDAGVDLRLCAGAAESAVRIMRPARDLVSVLPRRPAPHKAAVRRLDLATVTWKRVSSMDRPGAYRVDLGYRALHCLRTEDDIVAGMVRTGPQEVIKHCAAALLRRPILMAYTDHQVITPAHVGLPGLLERAAVLCSGFVAEERTNGQRIYRDVPDHIAGALAARLSA